MIKLDKVLTSSLLSFQQMIEASSLQMSDFFNQAAENQKKGLVSKSYIDQLEIKLTEKIKNNNLIDDKIKNEIHSRLILSFGRSITTSKYINVLINEHIQEEEKVKKALALRKTQTDVVVKKHNKPVMKKINTKVSSEKKK